MSESAVSRRKVLAAGVSTLAAAAALRAAKVHTLTQPSITNEEIVRKHYAASEKKDWVAEDALLADDFTFTSAAPDDHISKSAFKTQCWDTQAPLIERFVLERVVASESDVFVRVVCHTKSGKALRNVEYFQLKGNKIKAMECYFGGKAGYPSAANRSEG
jgi:ketosteroid isomerase-like protein